MKKILTFFAFIALSTTLIACGSGKHDIFISKYVENDFDNQAIELYNSGSKSVNLSNYDLALYLNGNDWITDPDRVITLEGTIEPKETFVIVNEFAEQKLLDYADFTTKDLIFDGNDVVHLRYKAKNVVDQVHDLGDSNLNFYAEIFVRAERITEGNAKVADLSHDNKEWDAYVPWFYELLGSHPVVHPEAPTLQIDNEIVNPNDAKINQLPGTLEMIDVLHVNDGDTAGFLPIESFKPDGEYLSGAFSSGNRIRYLGINTTEMDHSGGNHEPYAVEATEYMEEMLKFRDKENKAKIYLQFEPGGPVREGYGRVLAYVWADGLLTNYEQVLKGYSLSTANKTSNKAYDANNIYLFRWLNRAQEYAEANRLGLHS